VAEFAIPLVQHAVGIL